MVPPQNIQERYNEVRRKFCFYLDIYDNEVARAISKRIEDLGLVQEVFLTERVSHVVRDRLGAGAGTGGARRWAGTRDGAHGRADAMLQRVRANTHHHTDIISAASTNYIIITVQKAILILDKIYDTFFSAPEKLHCVRFFQGHFIKIEFLDKLCRPVYKEFEVWPDISLEPDLPKEKKIPAEEPPDNDIITGTKMTRKSRPKIKEKEEKETKGGYCEMCNTDYADAALHRRSPHHLAFVRDQTNFLALDSLIGAGADVATFLDKAAPLNGERRSLRIMCNGEPEPPKQRRGRRSQSPTLDRSGAHSPRRPNGGLDARGPRRGTDATSNDDRHYYKVVGVSTKLRSSGGFTTRRRESPPPLCNGAEPLVVKFRRVRRSELSVLSDEAEQFMFPKRASSTSSTSSDDEENDPSPRPVLPQMQPVPALERRRLARPLALKEESSEEDSWPEHRRKRKRRGFGTGKRGRPATGRGGRTVRPPVSPHPAPVAPEVLEPPEATETADPPPATDTNTPIVEPVERCLKWENGKLNYTPAVEQLEFAFERVPCSEPWFETFKRQDEDKVITRNVPQYFALYSRSPKLPYEIGPLPPLKPNCCSLSDLVKREERGNSSSMAGSSRGYGTRGIRRQRGRKRTVAALLALEAHPRKSPREHASTLAILGSAGLLHRRRHADDAKSTASEDTLSETLSTTKLEPVVSETRQMSERLQQFFSEVFEDIAEYDVSDDAMEGETAIITSTNVPDLLNLVSESGSCKTIRDEIKDAVPSRTTRRGYKFKKKNRTGWPNKKKLVKKEDSTLAGAEMGTKTEITLENRSSVEGLDTVESTHDESASETEEIALASYTAAIDERSRQQDEYTFANEHVVCENETSKLEEKSVDSADIPLAARTDSVKCDKSDNSLRLDVKVLLRSEDKLKTEEITKTESGNEEKNRSRSSVSEDWEREEPEKRRAGRGGRKRGSSGIPGGGVVCKLLQPVVRVARVDGGAVRTLRSAGRARTRPHPHRLR